MRIFFVNVSSYCCSDLLTCS